MRAMGIVKTKKEFLFRNNCVGDIEKFQDKMLKVIDIAVDGSGYLCLNCDDSAIGDIDKRDTVFYSEIPSDFDMMDILNKALNKAIVDS